jgi:hypothetical protein
MEVIQMVNFGMEIPPIFPVFCTRKMWEWEAAAQQNLVQVVILLATANQGIFLINTNQAQGV